MGISSQQRSRIPEGGSGFQGLQETRETQQQPSVFAAGIRPDCSVLVRPQIRVLEKLTLPKGCLSDSAPDPSVPSSRVTRLLRNFFFFLIYTQIFTVALSITAKTWKRPQHPLMESEVESLSRVRLFVNSWTVAHQLLCPWGFPGKRSGAVCHFLLQGIFLSQVPNPGLQHCRQMLYRLRHQGRSTNG